MYRVFSMSQDYLGYNHTMQFAYSALYQHINIHSTRLVYYIIIYFYPYI